MLPLWQRSDLFSDKVGGQKKACMKVQGQTEGKYEKEGARQNAQVCFYQVILAQNPCATGQAGNQCFA